MTSLSESHPIFYSSQSPIGPVPHNTYGVVHPHKANAKFQIPRQLLDQQKPIYPNIPFSPSFSNLTSHYSIPPHTYTNRREEKCVKLKKIKNKK